jgi:RNA polymerase sigma-70 factor (ECF subfamily)
MNPSHHDPALAAPPGAGIPLEKARWFEDEVHTHDARLKSYLRGSFPSVDVEDVVQESYLRTWLANAARPVKSAKAFLFTVARRLALNSVRHRQKSPIIAVPDLAALSVIDNGRDAAEAAAVSEEIALLETAIAALPPRCREIIILHKIQHIPQREVAGRLGISEITVQEQVYRGIRRMEAFFIKHGMIKPWQNDRDK